MQVGCFSRYRHGHDNAKRGVLHSGGAPAVVPSGLVAVILPVFIVKYPTAIVGLSVSYNAKELGRTNKLVLSWVNWSATEMVTLAALSQSIERLDG